ncbi:hypothetical protein [Paenibacillus silviterrae]|uniref:hypothetical protein n=1 Tax=Paenibacillus silviterrae TaxID=3242194 RepID=UPI00254273CA|nr:hypothetical protein [Paenibacillus chinjuensis]
MIECPQCKKATPYQKHCTHCGANLKQKSAIEQFDMLAERVAQALKEERRRRQRRRATQLVLLGLVVAVAVYVGLHI